MLPYHPLSRLTGSWQILAATPILLYPHPEGLRGEGLLCLCGRRKVWHQMRKKYGFKLALPSRWSRKVRNLMLKTGLLNVGFSFPGERYIWLGDFYCSCLIFHITPQCPSNKNFIFFASPRASRVLHHIPSQRPWKELLCATFIWLGKKAFVPLRGLSFNLEIVVKMENNTEQKQWSQLKDHHSESLGKWSL